MFVTIQALFFFFKNDSVYLKFVSLSAIMTLKTLVKFYK